MYAQLTPLRAMHLATTKHWQAARWWLERTYPERFGRRHPATFDVRQTRRLMNDVIDIVRAEIPDHYALGRLARRLRLVFADTIRAACASRRTSGELRKALELFERRKQADNPSESGDC